MKTKTILITLIAMLAVTALVFQSCKKDKPEPEGADLLDIPEETVEQIISASNGGTISFDNGLKLEVPANALNADTKITIQTFRPYSERDSYKSGKILTGPAVSQIVDCGPCGTTFSKPVKLIIPYYPELLPEGFTESNLLFLTYHNDQWDTLDINIDQENNLAYAYVNHFSIFKITKQDNTNWYLTDLILGNNNEKLTLSFKNEYGDNWAGFLTKHFNLNYDMVVSQEIYYEIKLYRSKILGKELIGAKQFYKGVINTKETNSIGKELNKGPEAENEDYFVFDELPKKANLEDRSEIFVANNNNNPGQSYASVDIVTFNKDKEVVSADFINLQNNIPDNGDFLAYSTIDGYNKYFEIVPMSELEQGKKYYFKIKIRSYGLINTKRFLGLSEGEFTTSKFTLDDIGEELNQNNPPSNPTNPSPSNNATNISINTNLSWTCTDPEGDALDYDIYFGTSNNPPMVTDHHTSTTYDPGTLDENTTYYWKIKAFEVGNEDNQSASPVWEFTTGSGGGNDTENPVTYFIDPVSGETVSGNYPVIVRATDNVGIERVEIHVKENGVYQLECTIYDPYNNDDFSCNWNTGNYSNGNHWITVAAYDYAGNPGSTAIEVTVDNSGSNTPPTALFTVSPSSGTTSTTFAFDASGSTDNEDPTSNLQVRWDFDGNGSWYTGWDYDKTENYQYSNESTYTAKLEVKDTEGLTNQYTKSITVSNGGGGNGCEGQANLTYGGQTYELVEIGNQCWMAENLNYETTNSWWYGNSSANGDVYGRLYTWEAALTACPSGWSLPSDDQWKQMEMALGMSQSEADDTGWRGTDEGEKMKSTSGWHNNGNGTNSSGFNALPGGRRGSSGSFLNLGYYGYWWSSTESSGTNAWRRNLGYDYDQVYRNYYYKTHGFSVRCLKN